MKIIIRCLLVMVITLSVSFALCLFLQEWIKSQTMIPTIFVLAVIYGSSCTILDNQDVITKEQVIQMIKGIRADSKWLIRMV